jgi:hypothetical protein
MGRRRSKPRESEPDFVVGVAWYRQEEWQRLLEVSQDRDDLETSYDEWAAAMPARMAEIEQAGFKPHKIEVAVDDLIAWCRSNGKLVDGAARADYVVHKLRHLHLRGHLDEPDA